MRRGLANEDVFSVPGERGIWIDGSEATTTYGNVVSGNTVSGAEEGFEFRYMDDSKISGNRAVGNHGPGIQLGDSSSGNDVVNNTIVGNREGITLVTDATLNLVSGNRIQGNENAVIVVTEWSTANTIKKNRIRDNGIGFEAHGESPDNSVEKNKFCHNDWPWRNSGDSDPTFYIDNKVCGPGR